MLRPFSLLFVAACLLATPRPAQAQAGGFPVQTTARTQFVFLNGTVVRREGTETTPLTQNVKLSGGTKINYKNGIVEMPADKQNPQGKKITLREGDYVRPDGGVVFATPGSAAAARGEAPHGPSGKFETYVQPAGSKAPAAQDATARSIVLEKKIALLTQKIELLSQNRSDLPDTKALDEQLLNLDAQLTAPK